MTDVITGLRQAIQDLVAPDLKALQANQQSMQAQTASLQESLQKQIALVQQQSSVQHDAVMKTIEAFRAEMRFELAALRANHQIEVMRAISPLGERLAVLERRGT